MIKEEYNYWIANLPGIGAKKIEMLLRMFGSVEEVFKATKKDLEQFQKHCCETGTRITEKDITALFNNRNKEKIHVCYDKLCMNGIYFVSKDDDRYPEKLKHIYGAPFALYVKGKLPSSHEKLLAIVGARECSPYGKEMSKYIAGSLAKEGIAVVSGLARGIDTYAHEGSLLAGGITYGILGCGIDICYPKENINIYMEIQKQGGILSEYAPSIQPYASNFPMRNRIISGLCDGVLVIEAKEKSGSLITVDMGLEQGKNIYALPGRITDVLSKGCNNLIKMGAKLVSSPQDILEDLIPNYEKSKDEFKKNNKLLETNGKIVYASLCLEPKHIEEIALITGLAIDIVMEQLLLLELRGYAKQSIKNYYIAG